MPVIVDEIVISVEVASDEAAGAAPGAAPDPQDRHALVSECVERVLDVLRRKEER
jgi:hypothetical protein